MIKCALDVCLYRAFYFLLFIRIANRFEKLKLEIVNRRSCFEKMSIASNRQIKQENKISQKNGFISNEENGYIISNNWILRMA